MGRNREIGLSYFPFDVDTFSDIKIRKLIKYQGGKAVTVYALLLCLIYKRGYYMRWDEELPFIISEQTGYEEAYIQEVIKSCLALGLFSKPLYDSDRVLTSKGIQVRYAEAMNFFRRKTEISAFSLISSAENGINATFMPINAEKTPRKEREGKEKKETNYVGKEKSPTPEIDSFSESENLKADHVDTSFGSEKNSGGGAANFPVARNLRRTFDENVRDCMSAPQWQESALAIAGFSMEERIAFSSEDWERYFELFRENNRAYGHPNESLREFRGHFTNWLRIQRNEQIKQQQNGKAENMGGNVAARSRQSLGRPPFPSASIVPGNRGKSVL